MVSAAFRNRCEAMVYEPSLEVGTELLTNICITIIFIILMDLDYIP